MTTSELDMHFKAHLEKEARIWDDLRWELYRKYIAQGYLPPWATVKAEREVLELKSKPVAIHPMPPKGEFHFLDNECLD